MKEYKNTELTAKHVICHNNLDVFHYSVVEPNDGFVTGQPFMEVFDSEEKAKETFPQVFPKIENELNNNLLNFNQ